MTEGLDDPQTLVALAMGLEMGDDSAPIKIVEFGDYMCPGCGLRDEYQAAHPGDLRQGREGQVRLL